MKRCWILAFLLPFGFVSSAPAQEAPELQLEFIRNLRSKGYSDLALEYIRELEKDQGHKLGNILQLETARTLVYLARKQDPDQRGGLLAQAKTSLEDFLKKAAPGPETAKFRMELARLSSYMGQALLSKALREETLAEQQKEAFKAEVLFIQAGNEIEEAAKVLPDGKEKNQALFDQANNLMEQARTYIDTGRDVLNRKKAKLIFQARKLYETVAKEETGDLGIMATAWLVKCCYEMTDPDAAKRYYKEVMGSNAPGAEAARRWARLFNLEGNRSKLDMKKETAEWLKDYPNHHKTPEGYAIRWEQAFAAFKEAQSQKEPTSPASMKMFEAVQKMLSSQNEPDNDFSEKANQLNISISLMRVSDKANIQDLKDFDDCYLRAQVELGRAKQVGDKMDKARDEIKDPKALEAKLKELTQEQQGFLKTTIKVLLRGLALADSKIAPSRLDDARYLLMSVYFTSGDLWRAAILGEALGKTRPPGKRAANGAGYSIEAYAALYERDKIEDNRQRLRDMLDYVLGPEGQKLWEHDRVTGIARFQLATLLQKDGDWKGAITQLAKMPRDFAGYTFSQGRLVMIAEDARKKTEDPKEKKALLDEIRKALARMPKLTQDIDPFSAELYFHSQLKEAEYLYAEAAPLLKDKITFPKCQALYLQMRKHVEGLEKELTAAGAVNNREGIEYYMGVLLKYARMGLSEIEYRQGNFAKVLEPDLTGQVVALVEKKVKAEKVAKMRDYVITGEILGLALRSNVQIGKLEEAKNILKLLENLRNVEEGPFEGSTNVLRNLVIELASQVKELQKSGDKETLKKTVDNFTVFLDVLIKQKDGKGQGLEKNEILFLAQCFDSLNQHDKAAGLYEKYPTPKILDVDKKGAKFTADEERDLQTYWYVRIKIAGQLREAKKYDEASKILDELLEHKNARMQLPAQKEKLHILEEKGFWGAAIKGWGELLKNPSLTANVTKVPELKELYFHAYYHHALSWYKYSQNNEQLPQAKKDQFITQAASYIVRLETSTTPDGWNLVGPRFEELLKNEPALNEAYMKLKR